MRKFLISIALVLTIALTAAAHPPSHMQLNYDMTKEILHVDMDHVAAGNNSHHIRRIVVTRNSDEPVDVFTSKQTTADKMIQDIPLSARPGDTITVKAYCSEGGNEEGSMIVPGEEIKP